MQLHCNKPFKDIQACFISRKVLEKATTDEIQGNIVGIFDNSFNVETCDRFIINIGTQNLPLTPRSILLFTEDFHRQILPKIYLGLMISCFNGSIYLPEVGLCISTAKAVHFNPKLELSGNLLPGNIIKRNLIAAAKWIEMKKNEINGLSLSPLSGYYLSRCSSIIDFKLERTGEIESPLTAKYGIFDNLKQKLWERIDFLLHAMRQYSWSGVSNAVRGIIGIGPGLTPSGDDFLSGFISVGVILSNMWRDIYEPVRKFARIVTEESIDRTTYVSLSMIEDASNGEIAEPAIKFIQSCLKTDNIDQIRYFAKKMISIGGSSGEDFFNGMATGIWFFRKMAFK